MKLRYKARALRDIEAIQKLRYARSVPEVIH